MVFYQPFHQSELIASQILTDTSFTSTLPKYYYQQIDEQLPNKPIIWILLLFQGTIVVMDILGNTVARVALRSDAGIVDLAWNSERFSMEEQDETQHNQSQNQLHQQQNRSSNNALRSSHGKKRSDGEHVAVKRLLNTE